jgi:hypothetical protein
MPSQIICQDEKLLFEISGEDYLQLRRWLSEIGGKIARNALDSKSEPDEPISSPPEQFMLLNSSNVDGQVTNLGLEFLTPGFLFEFEPNSIGLRVGIRNTTTGESLDLSHCEQL